LRVSEITSTRIFKLDSSIYNKTNPSILFPVLEIFVYYYNIRQIDIYFLAKILENRFFINNNRNSKTGKVNITVVEYKKQLLEFIILSTIV
jgi:hypothetical protein